MQFVRTKHGLMTPENAKAFEAHENSVRNGRIEVARQRAERVALAAGVSAETFTRLWKNGHELLETRMQRVREIAAKPTAAIMATYRCTQCRILTDDSYKAACAAKRLVPCFIRAGLKGCHDLVPRIVVAGHAAPAIAKPTPGASIATPAPLSA